MKPFAVLLLVLIPLRALLRGTDSAAECDLAAWGLGALLALAVLL